MAKTKLCKKCGCGRTAIPGKNYCNKHSQLEGTQQKKVFTKRGKSSEWHNLYNTQEWKRRSKAFLARYPTCFICGKPAKIADHIQPHRGDLNLFYDESNLQPMCWSCHSRKTFAENNYFKKGDRGAKT